MFKVYEAVGYDDDGRGSRSLGFYATEALAMKATKGQGTMGIGDGRVRAIPVYENGDQEREERQAALEKLTPRERELLREAMGLETLVKNNPNGEK